MKIQPPTFRLAIAWHLVLGIFANLALGASLTVQIVPRFDQAPLVFDSLTNQTVAGQTISVTRLDFLLSDFALHRADGVWLRKQDVFAFIDGRNHQTRFTLPDIPSGDYDRVQFHIGLAPQINHGDTTRWPANHPLNPDVNHLYWGWSREYVFLALEGHWQNGRQVGGFSYHIATDRELMTVDMPVEMRLDGDREMQLLFDVDKIFSTPNQIRLSDTTDTSHSRTNDTQTAKLRENIERAFAVGGEPTFAPAAPASSGVQSAPVPALLVASNATPYRFTFVGYFPQPNLPRDNPLTVEGVALGRQLFFDGRLSADNSGSCATCHDPQRAFSQPQKVSVGVDGKPGTRNAMTLENLAWKDSFFWDGRAATVREQVLQPIQNPVEMHESLTNLLVKLTAGSSPPGAGASGKGSLDADYPTLFKRAFGSSEITPDRIARALEQFVLAQVSCDSKFDRVMQGATNFTTEEVRGFLLFNTEYDPYHGQHGADCFHCHGGPLFQSQSFGNNGLDAAFADSGRYQVTHREGDRGKFSVPSLRNVAVTAPYMHDGRFQTLEEAVAHYCTGMQRSATLDPNLAKHPDGGVPLDAADQQALVAFLKTLTDNRYLESGPAMANR